MSITEPVPVQRRLLLDLSPLRESPAYARFWVSGVAGGIGSQLTGVAVGIHVYMLSGSTAALALLGALALAPMLIVGMFGGTLVDAFDRRKVLIAASGISFLAPAGIALLAWFDVTELWPYYVFTTLAATVGTIVGAARFAIHPRLVSRPLLPAAAALSGVSAGLQSAVGPALAGILVATVGFAWTYTIDLGLFLIGFWGIVSLPPIRPAVAAKANLGALLDGLRFLRRSKNLRTAIAIQIVSFAFGRSYALLPAVGLLLVGGGASTVGLLTAATAVGVIVSGVVSGRAGQSRWHGRAMVNATLWMSAALALVGALILLLELTPREVSETRVDVPALLALCLALALVGAADNMAGIFRTTMMQSATPDEMRGRLQGLYTLVLTAGPRLGDVFAGTLGAIAALWWPPLLGALLIASAVVALSSSRSAFKGYDALEPVP